jgi:hypothetical protein
MRERRFRMRQQLARALRMFEPLGDTVLRLGSERSDINRD